MTPYLQQAIKFFIVGGLSTVTHVGIVYGLVEYFAWNPSLATLPAFLTALILSYLINHRWTFAAEGQHDYYFPRFAMVAVTGLFLNWSIMYSTTQWFNWHYQIGLAIIVIVIPLFSFIMNRHWTFG